MKFPLAIAPALMVATSNLAVAEFIGNYSDWSKMTVPQRSSYAAGLADGVLAGPTGRYEDAAYYFGVNNCFKNLSLTPRMISQAITSHYEKDTDNWGDSPATAFAVSVIKGPCLKYMNEIRAKYRLPLWTKD